MVVVMVVVERWKLHHLAATASDHRSVELLLLGCYAPTVIGLRSGVARPQI
jgi:hypothetical protein